jgi:hypothetical protein
VHKFVTIISPTNVTVNEGESNNHSDSEDVTQEKTGNTMQLARPVNCRGLDLGTTFIKLPDSSATT